jgi:hypothetical protein
MQFPNRKLLKNCSQRVKIFSKKVVARAYPMMQNVTLNHPVCQFPLCEVPSKVKTPVEAFRIK